MSRGVHRNPQKVRTEGTSKLHLLWLIWLQASLLVSFASAQVQGSFVNFEGKQTRPVCLSPDGTRLFAVNTPDARLSVFDVSAPRNPILIAEISVGLEPVSVNALNRDEVWVVNEVSDSVSIVSVPRHMVVETLYVKDEPADVVFANGRAFVSASRNNRIAVFDITNRVAITNIPVFGENPRALALSPDGAKVYAAFALSGNRTTLVPAKQAPPQPPPGNAALPAPPQVSLIVDAADPAWTMGTNAPIQFTMPDNDVVEINTATLAITRYFPGIGTVNLGLAVNPLTGDLYVANTDARNLVRFENNLRSNFVSNRVSRVAITDGAITHLELNPGFSYTNFPQLPDLTNALAQPAAIVFDPGGSEFYVAAFGTDRIARMDTSGAILGRIELNPEAVGSATSPRTKRGPRGLALLPGQALYVLNRLANTIAIIDPQSGLVLREIPAGRHNPTPQVVREGRGFLYDAKLSGNGTVSCASCHIDSEMDLIGWDLGNPGGQMLNNIVTSAPGMPTSNSVIHPMKGPMTTQTLKGLKEVDTMHWRGDRTNFLAFNAAFDTLLGGALLTDEDMRAYRDFINTIVFQPNPNLNLNRSLPFSLPTKGGIGSPFRGKDPYNLLVYLDLGPHQVHVSCVTCHELPAGTTPRVAIAAGAMQEFQDFRVPQLRNVYQKLNATRAPGAQSVGGFGIAHDGAFSDVFTFLKQPVFNGLGEDAFRRDLDAFVQCFDTGMAPAVGYTRTLRADNVNTASISNDWNLLESQAVALTNADLIIKGTVDGWQRGFVYQPADGTYMPDTTNIAAMTRAQLRAKVTAGDTLTIMGVPPGSGPRMGIDRNLDGVLDGDVPVPTLRIALDAGRVVISWSTNDSGYLLERADSLPTTNWAPDFTPRWINGIEFSITNSLSSSNLFFRLREL